MFMNGIPRSAAGPSLVGRGGAGPQDERGVVGGGGLVDVDALAGRGATDGAVGRHRPLLTGAAAPEDHPGAVGGAVVLGVEALAADAELAGGRGDGLGGAAVAVPDDRLGAVVRGAAEHVQAAA